MEFISWVSQDIWYFHEYEAWMKNILKSSLIEEEK